MTTTPALDFLIVGSGPIGIACGVEAKKKGLSHLIIEKGVLLDALYRFPTNLVFFSTPDLLTIDGLPFLTHTGKPTRSELLKYYTSVLEFFDLNIHTHEEITGVDKEGELFTVTSSKGEVYRAKAVVLAVGFYDQPNMLNVPGEELPKVDHYYKEAHPYYRSKVAVIGGQNSAVESALELWRNGSEVTLIHRQSEVGKSVKYWIRPDIENRIKAGSINAYFNSSVQEIKEDSIIIKNEKGELLELENDFVLAMTGYHPDFEFLRKAGVTINEDGFIPIYNKETMETETPGLYIAGIVAGGLRYANKVFIENGRIHAKYIVDHFIQNREDS